MLSPLKLGWRTFGPFTITDSSNGWAVEKRFQAMRRAWSQKMPKPARTEVLPFPNGSTLNPTRGATFFQRFGTMERGHPASPFPRDPEPEGGPGNRIPGGAVG